MVKLLFLLLIVLWQETHFHAVLLFPESAVLQITAAIAAPILLPGRKLYWDWGIQMNYDMPSSLKQFDSVPIWPGIWDRKRRDLTQHNGNQTLWTVAQKYQSDAVANTLHPSDFTAGELYFELENLLQSYGFHETCLLRSVCELARHPFADDRRNLITEIFTFILTPSLHDAFAETEALYRDAYEQAEMNGFLHSNCSQLYAECQQDLLTAFTRVIDLGDESCPWEVYKWHSGLLSFVFGLNAFFAVCQEVVFSLIGTLFAQDVRTNRTWSSTVCFSLMASSFRMTVEESHHSVRFQKSFLALHFMVLLYMAFAILAIEYGQCALIYPRSTVFQLIGSFGVPLNDLSAIHKLFFDWGFQMNYDMPYNLSSFYMAPIWNARSHGTPVPQRHATTKHTKTDSFYKSIEDFLQRWGFHRSCLQRSICELAANPFEETHQPFLTGILSYLLTPSTIDVPAQSVQHAGYTMSELNGLLGDKCSQQYAQCEGSLLDIFTKIN